MNLNKDKVAETLLERIGKADEHRVRSSPRDQLDA
jgi:hypothetical protein